MAKILCTELPVAPERCPDDCFLCPIYLFPDVSLDDSYDTDFDTLGLDPILDSYE